MGLGCSWDGREGLHPSTTVEVDYKSVLFCHLLCSILTLRDYVLDLGHPYLWVQKLGGLHFPKEQPQVCRLTQSPWLNSRVAFQGSQLAQCFPLGL